MTKQVTTLKAALSTIVDFFVDEVEFADKQTGEMRTWNRLGYAQHKALSGFLYGLHNAVDYNENVRSPRLKQKYEEHRRDKYIELAEDVLRAKHELDDQIIAMHQMIRIAEEKYKDTFGKDYVYRSRITKANSGKEISDEEFNKLDAEAEKLFG